MSKDELLEKESVLSENLRALQDLVASSAWKKYSDLIDAQVKGRIDQLVLKPLRGIDETLEQEYAKGEIAGMRFSLNIVADLIDTGAAELEQVRNALGAEK
ncbi:MAG: hypothetical protein ACKOX6_00860 [Bdellovibrio sp.]